RRNGDPWLGKTSNHPAEQDHIRDVNSHIHKVISRRVIAADEVVQVEAEECHLPQMERIKKVCPARRIRYIAVTGNQCVIEMKRIVKDTHKTQHSRQNHSSRDFHVIFRTNYMRVAIVHDWLNGMRGGEKVLEALLEIFPEATIYTLLHERGKVSRSIESHPIVTSWLNRIPGVYTHY